MVVLVPLCTHPRLDHAVTSVLLDARRSRVLGSDCTGTNDRPVVRSRLATSDSELAVRVGGCPGGS